MASPYGHALVGLSLLNFWIPKDKVLPFGRTLFLYGMVILFALLPDFDFIPGLLEGNPSRFHHGPFHSLGMVAGIALLAGSLVILTGMNLSFLRVFSLVLGLGVSHLVLDFFTEDPSPPSGFPLFWPLTDTYYLSPWPILPHVNRDFSNPAIWGQILRVFFMENAVFLPLFLFSWWKKG